MANHSPIPKLYHQIFYKYAFIIAIMFVKLRSLCTENPQRRNFVKGASINNYLFNTFVDLEALLFPISSTLDLPLNKFIFWNLNRG